ncbi:MAG: DUF6680 family protein [Cetobacterium sp.]
MEKLSYIEAIIISGIVSIIVNTIMEIWKKYKENRNEKLKLFKILLSTRGYFNDYERVKNLNILEVVFFDSPKVLKAWSLYYDALNELENSKKENWERVKNSEISLLEIMAKELNYSKSINWETLKKPYFPEWLSKAYDKINLEHELMKNITEGKYQNSRSKRGSK